MTNKPAILVASIGMTLYAVHSVAWCIPALRKALHAMLPAASIYDDMYFGAWFALLMAVVICIIVLLIRQCKAPVSAMPGKQYRRLTYATTVTAIGALVSACLTTPQLPYHVPHLIVPDWWRCALSVIAAVWLWMMARQPGIGQPSKALRIGAIVCLALIAIPVLRMMASAIYWLATGYLLYYDSWAIASLVQIIVPTALLCWYSIELAITKQ